MATDCEVAYQRLIDSVKASTKIMDAWDATFEGGAQTASSTSNSELRLVRSMSDGTTARLMLSGFILWEGEEAGKALSEIFETHSKLIVARDEAVMYPHVIQALKAVEESLKKAVM